MLLRKRRIPLSVFTDFDEPIRDELFSASHLEEIAEKLAMGHTVFLKPTKGINFSDRVEENEDVLIESYKSIVKTVRNERAITPAAEWLIDNFYIVEEQLKDIRDHLPPQYYKELPKLSSGQFIGFPRVYAIAWDFVAHTDSLFNPELLKLVLRAYQKIQPLTIGELWAISITLRVVLIENLRRLSARIVGSEMAREQADLIADELLGLSGFNRRTDEEIIDNLKHIPLRKGFEVQLVQRLRFQEGVVEGVFKWLDERLKSEGLIAEKIVHEEHLSQTSANVTVRNIITSMRLMSSLDWRDLFEEVSLVDEKFQENPLYTQLDFATRDKYRHSVEELARGSKLTELEVAMALIKKTSNERERLKEHNEEKNEKRYEFGYYLISSGRYEFEKEISYKLKLRNYFLRWYVSGRESIYVGSMLLIALSLIAICFSENRSLDLLTSSLFFLLALFPASEIARSLINRFTIYLLLPRHLPRLDLSKRIPAEFKTFIVVPTMLLNESEIVSQVEQLEVHYLSNPDDSLYYALLSDWRDSHTEHLLTDDSFLLAAILHINYLNKKYGPGTEGKNRFYLFHRHRKWNEAEQKWMGWERKRGKLEEFNHFLRGNLETSFINRDEFQLDIPSDIKFVITLDSDTKLPRGAVAQLVGTFAHPLNHPVFDKILNKVVEGYGILQPRITPIIPEFEESTFFQRLSSGPCGIDPYAAAVSDVYQDLFGEGSYTGKGIYNVDVFERALKGRTPENRLLSHDLFEGNFARCALLSDVEFFEDFPSNFQVAISRNHRWTRGDWQLLPWIFGREGRAISSIGRWKMFDNLRRSLLMPALFVFLVILFFVSNVSMIPWILLIFFGLGLSDLLPSLIGVFTFKSKIPFVVQLRSFGEDLFLGLCRFIFNIIFIPYQAWIHLDAIFRTLFRLGISKRNLLEWTTSAQAKSSSGNSLRHFFQTMAKMELSLIFLFFVILSLEPTHWAVCISFFALWLSSPIAAWWISLPPSEKKIIPLSQTDINFLRTNARKIWHFFSTFVTVDENYLPPDNFQEDPEPIIAHRSSPTNFGLYLMSIISARDFGWIGLSEMIDRLETSLLSMQTLPRYNGHFYNWYDTTNKNALEPRYISSVDNGNFAGHLLAVAQSCEEIAGDYQGGLKYSNENLNGIQDSLRLLDRFFSKDTDPVPLSIIQDLNKLLSISYLAYQYKNDYWEMLLSKSDELLNDILKYEYKNSDHDKEEIKHWINKIQNEIKTHAREFMELNLNIPAQESLRNKLITIAALCRELFYDMDFSFLYDTNRKLFSIGYRVHDASLDASFYDLLASEARLLSFVAIAKGDVPVTHWFRLGRALTNLKKGTALISWSGSMFEYLMPSLIMQTPTNSLLEKTCRLIVKKQIEYANIYSIPWGMSESAYNVRDQHLTYQYSNFGVPDLAFKRGIGKDLVIAPYATILAGMYDATNAVINLRILSGISAEGRYGYYESIDFTKSRIQEKNESVIVKTYMAHHQGMSLVSISNIVHNSVMIKRFHKEPIIKSSQLLLQERTPRNIAIAKTRQEAVRVEHVSDGGENTFRQYFSPNHKVPRTQILSNGQYTVLVTSAGSGYSRFKNLFLSRWREDVTLDNWGSFIYLRDIHSHFIWSAGHQPTCVDSDKYEVVFSEDRAKITREDGSITSQLEVFISPEDNAEIRRLYLSNKGEEVRVIESTTYLEVVLASLGADLAHPIFSNLFIQTEYVPEITTLIASRRPRSSSEEPVWMAHVISLDSNALGEIEYETDRSLFIGRGRTTHNPIAIEQKKLSNTVGSVLDPILSIRSRIRIEPSETAVITYSTIFAQSREEIFRLAEKFHETSSYERTSNLAWTQAQVKLHYLGIDHSEASLFQQLGNRIFFLDSSLRVSSDILKRNTRNATNLWAYGISGDIPIVLVRLDEIEQRGLVRQVLRAHEYWRTKYLDVDLVILNEKNSSYSQELQLSIEAMVIASAITSGPYLPQLSGKVFTLRSDVIPLEDVLLLQTSAKAILIGRQGNLAEQVKRMVRKIKKSTSSFEVKISPAKKYEKPIKVPKLYFYNNLGGFTEYGLEYVIHLKNNESTPAPWINVIANPQFGFHVSESGNGSTWSLNSRENKLTPWSNDPVSDPTGECFYLYDNDRQELWSPTCSPIRITNAEYLISHGQGYSKFEFRHQGIHSTLTQFVHDTLPVKISKIVLKNESFSIRNLTITSYVEWVLGFTRNVASNFLVTEYDGESKSFLCHNSWNQEFGKRVAFATFVGGNDSWTGNRTEFIGRNGDMKRPISLMKNITFSGATGAGMDSCAALQKKITIPARGELTINFILGQEENLTKVQELVSILNHSDTENILNKVINEWNNVLEVIQVKTPDLSMNIMLNRWLLYQTTVCRLWARSAFYQSGGAFGFRDQLQDSMSMIWSRPNMMRDQILKSAARQFLEGDVQHWWHMPSGRGVRTHFSDDLLWLPYVVSYYLKVSEDFSLLDEEVSFLKGPPLALDQEDSYYTPEEAHEKGTIYEHCARTIDRSLEVGIHGFPLIGGGDWNDGMNRVGHEGKGESVWLAWFLLTSLRDFSIIAESRGESKRSTSWRFHLEKLKLALDENGWDGGWYRRAFYDDGTPLGSSINSECQIDSLTQSWGVISKIGNRNRMEEAMISVERHLVKAEDKMILLFTPPFDKTKNDPGYIKGYVPGVRENGGQYTHAAIWCVLAYTGLGNGKRAVELFSMLNPINHSLSHDDAHVYKVEPYVIAADVYSVVPHVGRGGWTWYTGSAGWMYTTGIEAILGFKLTGTRLHIDPCIHPEWKSYKIIYRYKSSIYEIEVKNPQGIAISLDKKIIELVDDGIHHKIVIDLKI
jgi:cyclic beta-1,2-glucan synthetase